MGLAMASHLQRHLNDVSGEPLCCWNRTPEKGAPVVKLGARMVSSVEEVAQQCDVIFHCLSDDAAVRSSLTRILAALREKKEGQNKKQKTVLVELSTVHPDTIAWLADEVSRDNIAGIVSSPVMGSAAAAEKGQLLALVSSTDACSADTVKPYLEGIVAQRALFLGCDVCKASQLKLVANSLLLGITEAVSAAHVMAQKVGVGSDALHSLIEGMFTPASALYNYSDRIVSGAYKQPVDGAPSFRVELAIKDGKHALALANGAGMDHQALKLALSHLEEARTAVPLSEGQLDSTAMTGAIRVRSGLPFKDE
ncbi:hypothetical protein L7F22_051391 [Adiantum nelumboides]|nr:hypothetical protein [Adiantum nelumboides]